MGTYTGNASSNAAVDGASGTSSKSVGDIFDMGGGPDIIRFGLDSFGTDIVNGGSGTDRLELGGTWADWRISADPDNDVFAGIYNFTIERLVGGVVVHTIQATNVERIRFLGSSNPTTSYLLEDVVDFAPEAFDDAGTATAVENGGLEVTGNVITSGIGADVDGNEIADPPLGEVVSVKQAAVQGGALTDLVFNLAGNEAAVVGTYGTLYLKADGSYRYVLGDSFAATDALAKDATATDVVVYNISDLKGLLSNNAALTLQISGANDAPVISVIGGDALAAALTETNASLTASGTLTVRDVDTGDTVTAVVDGVTITGSSGGLSEQQLLAMFSVTSGTINADAADSSNLAWAFNSGTTSAFDHLAAGETLRLSYGVTVSDADGNATDTDTVTITITGSNDSPVISLGVGDSNSRIVDEPTNSSAVTASGTLTVVDIDATDTISTTVTGVTLAGVTGSLAAADVQAMLSFPDASGLFADSGAVSNLAWNFSSAPTTFDFLNDGDVLTLTYAISSSDGKGGTATSTITITINGQNEILVGGDDGVVLTGTAGDDQMSGGAGNDTISGLGGDDVITGAGGNDSIDGGDGSDTVTYAEALSGNQFVLSNGKWVVSSTADGTDSLSNVEIVDGAGAGKYLLVGAGGFATIQAAVNAAAAGDTILVGAGTYAETVTVNKAVTILGANAGVAGHVAGVANSARGAESVVTAFNLSAGATLDGLKVLDGASVTGELAGVYVVASNVTVRNMVFERTGTVDGDTSRGLVTTAGTEPNLTVTGSLFTGWATGVYANDYGDTGTSISGNAFVGNFVGMSIDDPDAVSVSGNLFIDNAFEQIGVGVLDASEDVGAAVAANNSFTGSAPQVSIYAVGTGQTITGTDHDDVFTGSTSNDSFTGGAGNDTLILSGSWLDYGVSESADVLTLADSRVSGDGTDTATGIEIFQFTNVDAAPGDIVNDAPVAADDDLDDVDVNSTTASLNLLDNDSDADDLLGDSRLVTAVALGAAAAPGASGTVGSALANGFGTIVVAADGTANYTLDTESAAYRSLAATESATEMFNYTITDAKGLTGTATVSVTVNGANDVPVISVEPDDAQSAVLTETNAGLLASDTLTVRDVDTNDTVTASVDGVTVTGAAGGLSEQQLLAMFSVTSGNIAANTADSSNLGWSFNSGTANLDHLAQGETLVLAYAVKVTDSGGSATDTESVTITISGTNDKPVITLGTGDSNSATVDEPTTTAGLSTSGTLTVTDIDTTDTISTTVTGITLSGVKGSLVEANVVSMLGFATATGLAADTGATSNLAWTFNSGANGFDFLNDGDTLVLTYAISSSDGKGGAETNNITITINGQRELVSGGAGDDTLNGSNEGDRLLGFAGDDVLNGGAGDDVIDGGSADDALTGGSGDDLLIGGSGNVNITGGSGTDTVVMAGSWLDYTINQTSGTYFFTERSDVDGNNQIDTDLVTSVELVRFGGVGGTPVAIATVLNVAPVATADTGTSAGNVLDNDTDANTIAGDVLTVTAVRLGAGTPAAFTTSTVVDGALGSLSMAANGVWSYAVNTGAAAYVALAQGATATESFTYQIADAKGLTASTTLVITVTGQNDAPIAGTVGTQSVNAGQAFSLNAANAFTDPDTGDVLSFSLGSDAPSWLSITQAGLLTGTPLAGNVGPSTVTIIASDATTATPLTFSMTVLGAAPSVYTGTEGNDIFVAPSSANWTVDGLAGLDTLTTGAGNDLIRGGLGNDVISAGDGDDVIEYAAGDGNDLIDGGAGADTLRITSSNAQLFWVGRVSGVETVDASNVSGTVLNGTSTNDTFDLSGILILGDVLIDGGSGLDVITGTAASDRIKGGLSSDTLNGGDGDDVFLYFAGDGADVVNGGSGLDTILIGNNNAVVNIMTVTDVEVVDAGSFTGVVLNGTSSADTMDLSALTVIGDVVIDGASGNDVITGTQGADTIRGGIGNDTLKGGNGDDVFLFRANDGIDFIDGGSGNDTVRATADQAVSDVTKWTSIEVFDAGSFAGVRLAGTASADTIDLSSLIIQGTVSEITAGSGNDRIIGSTANDVIRGGAGSDTMTGGAGADTFIYSVVSDSSASANDRITDFVAGTDKIDLLGIDANSLVSDNQDFTFIGSNAFTSGVAGQLRVTTTGGNTLVQADINGDGRADFQLVVEGIVPLTAADFVL